MIHDAELTWLRRERPNGVEPGNAGGAGARGGPGMGGGPGAGGGPRLPRRRTTRTKESLLDEIVSIIITL